MLQDDKGRNVIVKKYNSFFLFKRALYVKKKTQQDVAFWENSQ